MLCQFSVKNYKSIREEITFDMQAAAISEHTNQVIFDRDGQQFLPVSVIYGPNGGGKSNVLKSLLALNSKVLKSIHASRGNENVYAAGNVEIKPFAFDEVLKDSPTEFELFFRTELAEYRYVLHVKHENIVFESLDRIKMETGRRSALYTRKGNDIELKGVFSKLKISDDLSETLPLLSYLGITYRKNEVVNDVLNWFEYSIDFLNYGNPAQELRTAIANSEAAKSLILDMIHEMGLDIEDFRIEEKSDGRIEVYTEHVVDGYRNELTLAEESRGTKKLFGLLPFIVNSLAMGTTLIIDELDAKVHPVLLKYIIQLFTNLEINRKGAQLIFTSHDLSTMTNELFRRDEIWFVAKGKAQNSQLYSLVEFKNKEGEGVRKDAKYDKQYLEGKYGADPYLRKIIDWSRLDG